MNPSDPSSASEPVKTGKRRFELREKFFPPRDRFQIKDGTGRVAFRVKFKTLRLLSEGSLKDPEGNEIAFIRQKLWALGANYGIYREGKLCATLKRTFSLSVRDHFTIETTDRKKLEIFCKFLIEGFEFFSNGVSVAQVSKKSLTLTDTMRIVIDETEDEILILACTLAVYAIYHYL